MKPNLKRRKNKVFSLIQWLYDYQMEIQKILN